MNTIRSRHLRVLAAVFAVSLSVPALSASTAHAAVTSGTQVSLQNVAVIGSTSMAPLVNRESAMTQRSSSVNRPIPHRLVPHTFASTRADLSVPSPAGNSIARSNPGLFGFEGLSNRTQDMADNGNQYDVEPPDQGLCVGNGYVIEGVNSAFEVTNQSGTRLSGLTSMNQFFYHDHEIDNSNGHYGRFLSDPKCYYDPATSRWFVTTLEIDDNPVTGAFGNASQETIAVSNTSSPLGSFTVYAIDSTDNTGTPSHAGCPCFGDQPADRRRLVWLLREHE